MTHVLALTFDQDAPSVAQLSADDGAPRRELIGAAFPIGSPSAPSSADGRRYQFDALPQNMSDLVDVVDEHDDDAVIGRLAVPFAVDDQVQLVDAQARLFRTRAADDVLELAREGVRTGFSPSVAFDTFTEDSAGVRHVTDYRVRHLGVVRRPAFTQSRGFTVAASAQTEERMDPATATTTEPQVSVVQLPTIAELSERVAEHLRDAERTGTHPLARFRNRVHFASAFLDANEDERQRLSAAFALVEQTTTDNPGLIVPAWRTTIQANLDRRRPAIEGTGGAIPLPDTGMSVEWPTFTGDLDALITQQLTEGAQLNSVKIPITKDDAPVETAGVASSIPYQTLLRTSPSYFAAHQAICDAAYARYTEAKFEGALIAGGTRVGAVPDLSADTGKVFAKLIWDMSDQVDDATGAPAEIVLVSEDIWSLAGGMDQLPNPNYGTQNAKGTADASTLELNVNGLRVRKAPFFAAQTMLATNSAAVKFSEQGPMTATQDQIAKLAQDVATWGMHTPAEIYFPTGVVYYDPLA